ncbi:MAG: hypothetical protein EPN47_04485 [Acidobacteria bacterium]|nr:MAG: hypothetical protein EPN47_04485 [Acidobacteriota bacterium]
MVRKAWNLVALKPIEIAASGLQRFTVIRGLLIAPMLLGLAALAPLPLRAQAVIAPGGRTLFNRSSLVRSFVERVHLSVQAPDGKFVDVTEYVTPLAFLAFRPPRDQSVSRRAPLHTPGA